MPENSDDPLPLLDRLREALISGNLESLGSLLADDVRWGPPDVSSPPCKRRDDVLSWYKRAQDAGASAEVIDIVELGSQIVVGLKVRRAPGDTVKERWQIYTVRNGAISDIVGFEDRESAIDRARRLA